MYKTARIIAPEGATITKGFHNLRRIPGRLLPHCGNLKPTYVSSGSCVTRIAGPNGDAQQTQGVNVSTGPAAFLPRCQTA